MPWDAVYGQEKPWQGEMPSYFVTAFSICFSEFRGAKFNWANFQFEEQK